MAEYIEREALYDELTDVMQEADADSLMRRLKPADVAPVMHGVWWDYKPDNPDWLRTDGKTIFIECSECRHAFLRNLTEDWNYCPNCGAKMDGGESE